MLKDALRKSPGDTERVAVERALAEFRAMRPVIITDGAESCLAFSIEAVSEGLVPGLFETGFNHRLIVPAIKFDRDQLSDTAALSLLVTPASPRTIAAAFEHGLAMDGILRNGPALKQKSASFLEASALVLSRIALLLPGAVVFEMTDADDLNGLDIHTVSAGALFSFRDREAGTLEIVSRAPVPLEGADASEFVVFRGGDGLRDQVAVIVGSPRPPAFVRIHSACLTGDLFGSLKCDCGDQLRGTVRTMAEHGGGIVLYLDQEGRGNGIANKIRAYDLQAQGADTFDADRMLGFGQDQRRFDFAAEMLRQLGYTSIRLLTNNPQKVEAVKATGIEVVSDHRILGRTTPYNFRYLTAKRDKAGHMLGDVALDGVEIEDVLFPDRPLP